MFFLLGLLSSILLSQTSPSDGTSSPPMTNSGEVFKDPFADQPSSPLPAPVPEENLEAPVPTEDPAPPPSSEAPVETFPDPFSEPAPVTSPTPAPTVSPLPEESETVPPIEESPAPSFQPVEPAPSISEPKNSFEFPDYEAPEGPVSQEVNRRSGVLMGTPVGTWHWSLVTGAGINFNRRPTQVNFEAEVGYRFWEKVDLNLLTNFRFVTDRILGFVLLPSYTFRISGSSLNRFDLRAGMGTGWIFRGVTGKGFQYGYIPLRTDLQLIYYFMPRFGILVGGGTETLLFRWSTNREYFNEFSDPNGPPTQTLLYAGFRMEF